MEQPFMTPEITEKECQKQLRAVNRRTVMKHITLPITGCFALLLITASILVYLHLIFGKSGTETFLKDTPVLSYFYAHLQTPAILKWIAWAILLLACDIVLPLLFGLIISGIVGGLHLLLSKQKFSATPTFGIEEQHLAAEKIFGIFRKGYSTQFHTKRMCFAGSFLGLLCLTHYYFTQAGGIEIDEVFNLILLIIATILVMSLFSMFAVIPLKALVGVLFPQKRYTELQMLTVGLSDRLEKESNDTENARSNPETISQN